MRTAIRILIGFACFIFLVIQPLRANLIASLATSAGLDPAAQAILLDRAYHIDPCASEISNRQGDTYLSMQNYPMAAIAYGNAMICSPGRAEYRFKYGQMILGMGFFDGKEPVKDAATLEPNNPYYGPEYDRVTKLQSQLQ